ncbi:hypothetical protein BDR26DRAFT_893514 [Obelidium mucronatum]|nr:hypothetical protein BDR26DRAFT_893514 [Obelidium mucronatum]
MSPHLISLAETVYFDGNEGYSEEEDIDEDEQEFGYKSWFNIGGESMENIRAKLANRNVKESAILKARNGALSSSKLALIIHLARMQLSLGKYEFDCVQLLLNDIQLYQDLLNPNVEGSNSENEDSDAFEFDLSHAPFIFSVVLRVDEIVCGLYKVNGENGALDWAYHIQMNESHIVAAVREGGNIDAHIEMDRITFLNIDKQPIFLRSENLSERRPMMAIAFNSIFDKTIGMKENSVSISLSELRFFVVDQILLDLVTDINSFLVEPPGLEPVPVIDAVTKLTFVLNGIVVDYRPMYRQFRAVLHFETCQTVNDIGLHLLKSSSYIGFDIDEQTLMIEKGVQTYLEKCRYANVFACDLLGISYRQTRGLNQVLKTEVELSNGNAYLDFCLDSHRLLMDILEYIGAGGDGQYLGIISEKLPSIQREKNILVDVPDMDRILETIDDKAFAKFIPSTKSSEREYNENELDVSDVLFGGAIAISDPRSHIQKEEILVYDEGPFEFYGDYLSLTGTPGLMDDMIVPEKLSYPDDDSDSFSGHPLEKSMMEDDDFETQPKDSPSNGTPTLEFRSSEPRIQINLTRVNVESKIFPETNVCASELLLSIDVLEVIDNVTTSMWRKFLTAMRPGEDDRPLETGSSMLIIDWVKVRPKLEVPESQEIRLKVHVSPLRFYVDQDALAFIGNFLSYGAKPVQETDSVSQETAPSVDNEPKSELFFPFVGGNLLEVFNFVPLEGAEMTLNQVRLNGVQGVEKLISLIRNQWLQEVTKNQPHRVVKGLSGIKPIANIGAGIADLILLPWKQYQREGKVLRGFEKGAKSFSKTAAMETLALGTRLAITTQAILEGVERNAGSTSVGRSSNTEKNKKQGAQSLARNVNDAVKTVLDAPGKGRQNEGSSAGAVARAVPVAILRPVIGATEAVSKTLLGLQNTIDPTKKKQMEDKYKG